MSVLIVVPTYNEAENLAVLLTRLRAAVPDADVLIVDDNSPDGTGALAEATAKTDTRLQVLHRPDKRGLGRAYVAGLGWGIARGYDFLVQMDADLSHDPDAVPALLTAAHRGKDLVLGSRYVPGGGTRHWGLIRRVLSRGGNGYARTILGVSEPGDLTGGFKCWRRATLEDIDLGTVRSDGYSFQIETTYRTVLRGHTVAEVPITFAERRGGRSKLSRRIILEAIIMPWRLRAQRTMIREGRSSAESNPFPAPVRE